MAARYVGGTPDTVQLRAAEKLGFYDPIHVQYWHWLKGVVSAPTSTRPRGWCTAPRRAWATRSAPASRCCPRSATVPGDAVAGRRRGDPLAGLGVAIGVLSALRRGSFFDRAAMTVALAGVSLPIFWTGLVSLAFFSYTAGLDAPGGSYIPLTENPVEVGLRPAAAVDHARAAVLGAVRPAHPRRHARDHG